MTQIPPISSSAQTSFAIPSPITRMGLPLLEWAPKLKWRPLYQEAPENLGLSVKKRLQKRQGIYSYEEIAAWAGDRMRYWESLSDEMRAQKSDPLLAQFLRSASMMLLTRTEKQKARYNACFRNLQVGWEVISENTEKLISKEIKIFPRSLTQTLRERGKVIRDTLNDPTHGLRQRLKALRKLIEVFDSTAIQRTLAEGSLKNSDRTHISFYNIFTERSFSVPKLGADNYMLDRERCKIMENFYHDYRDILEWESIYLNQLIQGAHKVRRIYASAQQVIPIGTAAKKINRYVRV